MRSHHPLDTRLIAYLVGTLPKGRVIDAIDRWQGPGEWEKRNPYQIQGAVIHQSLGSGKASALARYHTGPNHILAEGLPGPAYWVFIDKDAVAWVMNSIESRTWSHGYAKMPGDENAMFAGICVGGSFAPAGPDAPTSDQIETLSAVWGALRHLRQLNASTLFSHADFGKSTCPGQVLQDWVEDLRAPFREEAAELLPLIGTNSAELWQRALQSLGHFSARQPIDGIWGRYSRGALDRFRREAGLPATSGEKPLARQPLDQWVLYSELERSRRP